MNLLQSICGHGTEAVNQSHKPVNQNVPCNRHGPQKKGESEVRHSNEYYSISSILIIEYE